MADKSGIGWTDATWNPVSGCTRVGPECDNCYAKDMTGRLEAMGQGKYTGLTTINLKGDRHFNGVVRTHADDLGVPLRWKRGRRIFVNSMSDTFHRDVPFEFVDRMFAVMALCRHHTFQVLTKRPERAAEYFAGAVSIRTTSPLSGVDLGERDYGPAERIGMFLRGCGSDAFWKTQIERNRHTKIGGELQFARRPWPLPNVHIGTSCGIAAAKSRIDHLRQIPAAVRFVSFEPLIEDLGDLDLTGIHWAIVGGESGRKRRPMDLTWMERIVRQCDEQGVAVFVKQDSGPRSGLQGSIPDDLWARKEFPEVARAL